MSESANFKIKVNPPLGEGLKALWDLKCESNDIIGAECHPRINFELLWAQKSLNETSLAGRNSFSEKKADTQPQW